MDLRNDDKEKILTQKRAKQLNAQWYHSFGIILVQREVHP